MKGTKKRNKGTPYDKKTTSHHSIINWILWTRKRVLGLDNGEVGLKFKRGRISDYIHVSRLGAAFDTNHCYLSSCVIFSAKKMFKIERSAKRIQFL